MKNTLLAAIAMVLLSAGNLAAQSIQARQIELGGATSVTFSRTTLTAEGADEGSNTDSTAVAANLGYFVSERVGVGVDVTYSKFSFPGEAGAEDFSLTSSGIGPFVRYRLPLGDRAAFVVTGAVAIVKNSVSGSGDPATDQDTTGTSFSGGAGVNFFIVDEASFNFGVRYQMSKIKQDGQDAFDSSGLVIGVGFSFYFNR